MVNLIVDSVTDTIAKHLKKNLNCFAEENYSFKLVNGIRNFNDPNVPVNEYPVLKVWRVEDSFQKDSQRILSTLQVQYGVVIDKNYKTVPLLNLVGRLIHSYVFTILDSGDIITSLRIQPKGALTLTEPSAGDLRGFYDYTFGIEDGSSIVV